MEEIERAVGRLGLGCAPLGNLFESVSDEDALATVDAAWDRGVRGFDTAPLYGHGESERRLGRALRDRPRAEFELCTKVGRVLVPVAEHAPTIFCDLPAVDPVFDFSRDGVLRSLEASLDRLGTDRIDVLHVHDPDEHETEALAGAFPTLIDLREQGVVGRVGAGMNQCAMLTRFVERVDLDCILVAGRYSLLDHEAADVLFPVCEANRVDVYVGGVFNSGLLARPSPGATFDYVPAPAELVARARAVAATCAGYGVELPHAAIQFALAHPAVTKVLVGARHPDEITSAVTWAEEPLPPDLAEQLGVWSG
jgi:D-threo-aldose 1-dehydrogenase